MPCHDMMSILYTKWQLNFDIQPDKLNTFLSELYTKWSISALISNKKFNKLNYIYDNDIDDIILQYDDIDFDIIDDYWYITIWCRPKIRHSCKIMIMEIHDCEIWSWCCLYPHKVWIYRAKLCSVSTATVVDVVEAILM